MTDVPTFTLPSGTKVPAIAYGSGTLWIKKGDETDRGVVDAVKTALSVGYRHLDGAQRYNTEGEVGLAMEESGVPRKDIFLTTKVFGVEGVESALKESLAKLKTDYVDLYLIHTPFGASSPADLQNAWREMERCLSSGLALNIGVSNFAIPHLKSILEVATTKPAVCQIELHPYLQQPTLVSFLREHGICPVGYGSLAPLTKASGGPADGVCGEIAERHGVSVEAVLLRWVVELGGGVVTTSGKKERMEGYLRQVPGLVLSKEEVGKISEVSKKKHFRAFFVDQMKPFEEGV